MNNPFWLGFKRGFTMPWTIITDYFQFVWWGWHDMQFGRSQALQISMGLRVLYSWAWCFGPLEIRKWRESRYSRMT